MNSKKTLLVFFFLFFVCFGLFAAYTITGYNITIEGKTKEAVVRSIIGAYNESFESEEQLKLAIERKKQSLINTRLFIESKINFSYILQQKDLNDYDVLMNLSIKDARNAFFMPYPKYDSNTGVTLGLRYKNRNFRGRYKTFDINFDAAQHDSSFSDGNYYLEIPFESIKIKDVNFSGSLEAKLDFFEKNKNYVALTAYQSGLHFGKVYVSTSTILDYNYHENKFRKLKLGYGESGITIGKKGMNITSSTELYLDWLSSGDTYLVSSLGLNSIPVGKVRITNSNYLKWTTKGKKTEDGLQVYQFDEAIAFGFTEKLAKWGLRTGFSYYPEYDTAKGNYLTTTTSVSYRVSAKFVPSLLVETQRDQNHGLTSIIPAERLTFYLRFKDKIPFTWSIAEHNDYKLETQKVEPYFSTSLSTSYGSINWTGNYRKGTVFNIMGEFTYKPWNPDGDQIGKYRANMSFTSFPIAREVFNPSLRFMLLASNKSTYWEDDSGWRLDTDQLQGLFRGIKTADIFIQRAYTSAKAVCALNINLCTRFMKFEDFGSLYLNLFADAGLLHFNQKYADNQDSDVKVVCGSGIEFIGVMDKYPAYPVRASVGFDAESIYKKFIAKEDDVSLGFEIYFGLGWFF